MILMIGMSKSRRKIISIKVKQNPASKPILKDGTVSKPDPTPAKK